MRITGAYTGKGAQHAAKIQSGVEKLLVSRVVAGQGKTTAAQQIMAAEKQVLKGITVSTSGANVHIKAMLPSAMAATNYVLNEIGVYVREAGGGEVLYKIFTLDKGVDISRAVNMTIGFTLVDSILTSAQPTVEPTVNGLVTTYEAEELVKSTLIQNADKNQNITCPMSQLQTKIDALPKLLEGNILINVTAGTLAGNLIIDGFYGSGSICIKGENKATTIISGYVSLTNCKLEGLKLIKMSVAATELKLVNNVDEKGTFKTAILVDKVSKGTALDEVEVIPPIAGQTSPISLMGCCGLLCRNCDLYVYKFMAQWRQICFWLEKGARVLMLNAGNNIGVEAMAYRCDTCGFLCNDSLLLTNINISSTMGASTNTVRYGAKWQD